LLTEVVKEGCDSARQGVGDRILILLSMGWGTRGVIAIDAKSFLMKVWGWREL
jgi:hypothetical protein